MFRNIFAEDFEFGKNNWAISVWIVGVCFGLALLIVISAS